MQESPCDFIETGEGCKVSIITSNIGKHKKGAIVKHVDLLNDDNKALKARVSELETSNRELQGKVNTLEKDMEEVKATLLKLTEVAKAEEEKKTDAPALGNHLPPSLLCKYSKKKRKP